MSDPLQIAKDIAIFAAAGAVFLGALRVARQSKTVTDDIGKGSKAYTDVRGNQDSENDRERRGLLGDMTYLLGRRGDAEGGIIRELTKKQSRQARELEQQKTDLRVIKALLMAKGELVSLNDAEFEDTGNRRLPSGVRRNTPTGGENSG